MSEILRETWPGSKLDGLLATLRQRERSGGQPQLLGQNLNWSGDFDLTCASVEPPVPLVLYWFLKSLPTGSMVTHAEKALSASASIGTLPATEQIALVVRFLGLGKSQVARIFNVSRQTIYDWLKGRCEPTGSNATNLSVLAKALHVSCAGANRPLFHRYVTESAEKDEPSVLDILQKQPWLKAELTPALERARRRTEARHQRLGQQPAGRATEAQAEDNLLDNSIAENLE